MSLFVISDLHLSTDAKTNKSMDVFGNCWQNYILRIEKNWKNVVKDEDSVIIPGDISWAMNLDEAYSDLKFIDLLPGRKYLGKGNHDFWWATASKMNKFFAQNGFNTLSVLYNNAYIIENTIVCGTRGWFPDEDQQTAVNNADYDKIINREIGRLKLSLDAASALQKKHLSEHGVKLPVLVFMHFPPVWNNRAIDELILVLKSYEIERCFYGHIHNAYTSPRTFEYDNISFTLTSSDFLGFLPLRIT